MMNNVALYSKKTPHVILNGACHYLNFVMLNSMLMLIGWWQIENNHIYIFYLHSIILYTSRAQIHHIHMRSYGPSD
jgi:hypothetical protein